MHDQVKVFSTKNCLKEIEKVNEKIEKIVEYKTQGAMVRTHRNWIKYGEKNCKFFFNLEKYNFMSKNRFKLRNSAGKIITKQEDILTIQHNYYAQLYKLEDSMQAINENYLNGLKAPRLTDEQRQTCDQIITSIEIRQAITQLKKERTPGNDGFPIEWYEKFYHKLKHILVPLYRVIARYGLPDSSKKALYLY